MLKTIYILVALSFSKVTVGQDINLIIQVNDKLQYSGLSNVYVTVDTIEGSTHYPVDYVPGNLKLQSEVIAKLNSDTSTVIYLHLTNNTFKKGKYSANFFIKLTQYQLRLPYLIWGIYDFRNSRYRRWYQTDKKQQFASDLIYPNSGILIRHG